MPLKALKKPEEMNEKELKQDAYSSRLVMDSAVKKIMELTNERDEARMKLDLCIRFLTRLDQNELGGRHQMQHELDELLATLRQDA